MKQAMCVIYMCISISLWAMETIEKSGDNLVKINTVLKRKDSSDSLISLINNDRKQEEEEKKDEIVLNPEIENDIQEWIKQYEQSTQIDMQPKKQNIKNLKKERNNCYKRLGLLGIFSFYNLYLLGSSIYLSFSDDNAYHRSYYSMSSTYPGLGLYFGYKGTKEELKKLKEVCTDITNTEQSDDCIQEEEPIY